MSQSPRDGLHKFELTQLSCLHSPEQKMADERTTAQVHPEKLTHALLDHAKENGAKEEIGTVGIPKP